jgi:predicted metalloprotease with PDZ domain
LLAPAAAVILVAAIALAELLPTGSSRPRRRTATAPTVSAVPSPPPFTTPAPATTSPNSTSGNTISGHPVTWLGMEISTENGTSVIQTVQLGSPADAAGLNPGDVIQTVNGHPISAAEQIRTAVRNLRPGDAVQISVVRGSTFFTTVADFAGQPTTSP